MIDTRRIALRRPALEFPPDLLCSGTDGKEEDLGMRFANRTTRHALTAFASASNSKGHSGILVRRFVNVFLKIEYAHVMRQSRDHDLKFQFSALAV